jgi:hypothetical protein
MPISLEAGPKSGINNSKIQKWITFTWHHFMWPRCEENIQNLNTADFWKSLHRMSYHIQGCMAFRSNKLAHSLDHGKSISDTRVALGWWGTPRSPFSISSHEILVFHFRSVKLELFCKAATEMIFQKLGTTFHINIRPPVIHLVSTHKPSEVSSVFCARLCRFRWKWAPN